MPKVTAFECNRRSRPRIVFEDDEIETAGFLDSNEFCEFTARVKDAIYSIGAASIADIRRELGDDYRPNWVMDALEALNALGDIEDVQAGALRRYRARERRAEVRHVYNRTEIITPPSPRTHPFALLHGR